MKPFTERPTPSNIYQHILENLPESAGFHYQIIGCQGPTGKTWLCNKLKELEVSVVEDPLFTNVMTYGNCTGNYFCVDNKSCRVVIVLNDWIDVELCRRVEVLEKENERLRELILKTC